MTYMGIFAYQEPRNRMLDSIIDTTVHLEVRAAKAEQRPSGVKQWKITTYHHLKNEKNGPAR